MSRNDDKRETAAEEKEPLSRVSKRQKDEARKKRRVVLILVLLVIGVLAVGAAFDIPYINIAREAGRWVGERFSGPDSEEAASSQYLYFTDPQTNGEMEGEVAVLTGVYMTENGQRTIIDLALLTYDRDEGKGEIYFIPETSVAYNADGDQIELRQALEQEGGEDLLRSTVGNITGAEVDYLLLFDFWEAARLVQGMGFPAVVLDEITVLVNPLNGETNYLVAGSQVKDGDRLLFYMLATDNVERWESFSMRLERAKEYLPRVFAQLKPAGLEGLQEMLTSLQESFLLDPGTGSADGDKEYIASMFQAFTELDEGEILYKAVPSVEILNGCGIPDLGKRVGDRLASLGVPVAGTGGNAKITVDGEEVNDFSHETSTIIYRSEDTRVESFARYLGVLLSVQDVVFEPGPGPAVVVIAGKDLAV